MHSFNGPSPILTVYLQVEPLPHLNRQRLLQRAEAEAVAILSRHPDHEIWVHIFEFGGINYALSSRNTGINGSVKIVVDVTKAPDGLTRRTIVKVRQAAKTEPTDRPGERKKKSPSKPH